MSDLRNNLDAAKREYRAARYPGNLATELLGESAESRRPYRIFRITAFVGVASGIAAALVVWMVHRAATESPSGNGPKQVAVNVVPAPAPAATTPTPAAAPQTPTAVATAENESDAPVPVAGFPTQPNFPSDVPIVPSDIPLVPSASTMEFPSMPEMPSITSIPSMDFDFSSDVSSDQKEST
jgi:hypothetical protein